MGRQGQGEAADEGGPAVGQRLRAGGEGCAGGVDIVDQQNVQVCAGAAGGEGVLHVGAAFGGAQPHLGAVKVHAFDKV